MEDVKVKKVCGFSISSIHFSMMILPYINKELELEKNVITILEGNLEKNIKQVLSKITLNNETKQKILDISWEDTDIKKSMIEKKVKLGIENKKDLDIIVYGNEKFINLSNEIIEKTINKSSKNIKIINCYMVDDFNENIREILKNHQTMFNTSGEHKIEEIFNEYFSA